MDLSDFGHRGIGLLGCGKMGSALLRGWLAGGVPAASVHVVDPQPGAWLRSSGVAVNQGFGAEPAIVLVAVKPQMMGEALPALAALGGGTVILSIAAGTRIAAIEAALGPGRPVIRAMPNTPAAIGRGITAICGNAGVTAAQMDMAVALLGAVGQVVRLDSEEQIDAVTAVSGSGPAYVFHLIETLAAAGVAEGLPPDLAMTLARATVAGAGALAEEAGDSPGRLRENVTSPGGTTAAALAVLMNEERGFPALLKQAVHAAAERGRELGK